MVNALAEEIVSGLMMGETVTGVLVGETGTCVSAGGAMKSQEVQLWVFSQPFRYSAFEQSFVASFAQPCV